MTQYRVAEIVRDDVPTLTPEMPIRRAVTELVQARAAAAIVIGDDGGLVGLLSQKDCFQHALKASYYQEWMGSVADQMSRNVICVDKNDDVVSVAEKFLSCPHRVFPVLDGAKVIGLVHRSDVLALLIRIG